LTLSNTLSYFNAEFIRECKVQPPDVRIRETSEPLAGAMTFSVTTFTIMTFNIMAHIITTFVSAIKSNNGLHSIRLLLADKYYTMLSNTLSYYNTEFITTTESLMVKPPDVTIRESSEPAGAMTLSIMTFTIMTFNIMAHSITTFSKAMKKAPQCA
jgi:hypothetical protein